VKDKTCILCTSFAISACSYRDGDVELFVSCANVEIEDEAFESSAQFREIIHKALICKLFDPVLFYVEADKDV